VLVEEPTAIQVRKDKTTFDSNAPVHDVTRRLEKDAVLRCVHFGGSIDASTSTSNRFP
jgi:hypothetical protein